MNKKGFTLIELLAVIIILGILMIIAIPSVTKYINDSRKNAYVDTAKEIVSGTRNKVNDGKLGMFDTNTTYYIPSSYIQTENASKSPYGEFTEAYIGVIYDGKGYKYYWISVDDAGEGVKDITLYDKLDIESIESDLTNDMIKNTVEHTGIGNRTLIKILNPENETWRDIQLDNTNNNVSEEGGESKKGLDLSFITFTNGKNELSIAVGDIVKIGTEEFYVYKKDTNKLYLLAHYNLKVGNIGVTSPSWRQTGEYQSNDTGYGLQSSEAVGYSEDNNIYNGTVVFSDEEYFDNKVGSIYPGIYCDYNNQITEATECAYIYDDHSNLKSVVDSYKAYLVSHGAPDSIEARLLRVEEAVSLGCVNTLHTCSGSPEFLTNTSYWLGSAWSEGGLIWAIYQHGFFGLQHVSVDDSFGIRPVIVVTF